MEGNAGRVGWGEPREGVEGTERTRSGRRGPQAPQRLVIQNPHFSTTLPRDWKKALIIPIRKSSKKAAILKVSGRLP
ncbi:hypothetical protein TNCV_3262091 [Trichonephila clavipes]|nr:hypothetical protein TNCV_3262091 [Trichonephila clavipes]